MFKSYNKLCNNFCFKDPVPQILTSGAVFKFQVVYAMNSITENVRHLTVRSGKQERLVLFAIIC